MAILSDGVARSLRAVRWYKKHDGKEKRARISVKFDLFYPADHSNPATDAVLLEDLLYTIGARAVVFHKVPGCRIVRATANGKRVL